MAAAIIGQAARMPVEPDRGDIADAVCLHCRTPDDAGADCAPPNAPAARPAHVGGVRMRSTRKATTVSPIASVCAADDAGVCAAPNLPEVA